MIATPIPIVDSLPPSHRWTEYEETPTILVRVGTGDLVDGAIHETRPLVYVLEWILPYDGNGIVDIYTTLDAANAALADKMAEGDPYYTYIVTPTVLIGA